MSEPTESPITLDAARGVLQQSFGFDDFRDGQAAVIGNLLAGHSAAAVFPTGGGKSLCYQLPGILLPGLTLVVSPLIALMKDQIDALRAKGIAAARLDSSLEREEYLAIMDALKDGTLKLLYVAPERFANERFREQVERQHISLFAVDEAHCISEWGHNFRPDYLKLPFYAGKCGAERLLALTATAPPRVLKDIQAGFEIGDEQATVTGFYRPNLILNVVSVTEKSRDAALVEQLRQRPPGPGIIYVTLQRTAQEVASRLRAAGFEAEHYHAGMKPDERSRVQEQFLASQTMSIVATIAFGMGIDKPDIRYIDHYNLPKSLENYAQEIGRAGRDGESSTCTLWACRADRIVLENFVYGDTPSQAAIHGLLEELLSETQLGGETQLELALHSVAQRHDLRILVLRTLLTQLELRGFLEAATPVYSSYRFKALASSQEILGRFAGERRQFLAGIFRQAKKGRTWLTLDLEVAASQLGAPRQRLIRALDYLAEQQLLEVEASGVRHRYQVLQTPADLAALANELEQQAIEFETREVGRIGQVLEMAGLDSCLNGYLCHHFGEEIEGCGHCSWCQQGVTQLSEEPAVEISEELWQAADAVRQEHASVLSEPRAFCRFLTGLTSPRLGRSKLSSHEFFGCLARVPFAEVLRRAEG